MITTGVKPSALDALSISAFRTVLGITNSLRVFNIVHYGAVGDDLTNNTVAIQAAIDDAAVSGGLVYVPSGIYRTNTLTSYWNVCVFGDGITSKFKSVAAEILIQVNSLAVNIDATMALQHLYLDGANIGTIGFYNSRLSGFVIHDLFIKDFTVTGFKGHGTLVCSFHTCTFWNCGIGAYMEKDFDIADSAPNLIIFKQCSFLLNKTQGFKGTSGLLQSFENCNFGLNGTNGDTQTGAIWFKGASGIINRINVGLSVKDCWFEGNYGWIVNIQEPTANMHQLNVIENSMFILNPNATAEIRMEGTAYQNRLILRSSSLQGAASLILDGANASCVNDNSEVSGTITRLFGAPYYTMDKTLV